MQQVFLDYETASDIPIEAGINNYLKHKSAKVICMGWAIDDGQVHLWTPGHSFPIPSGTYKFYAHNAFFDFRVWNWLCTRRENWPQTKLHEWIDTMALCGRYGLPQSLDSVGVAMNLSIQKNPRGKALIKKICCPPYQYTESELKEFYAYCVDDVRSMRSLIRTLPAERLSDFEQEVWETTMRINYTGLPIDIKSVKHIARLTEAFQIENAQQLPEITKGIITKPTQTVRIKKWINSRGINIPNTQAATVESYLEQDLPEDVKQVLTIRQMLGSTSIAKYKKLVQMEHNGRVYDNLRYFGAATGRWSGLGFQVHNLPRASVPIPEETIKKFFDFTILEENPVLAAKALIRPMIKAPPGSRICAIDYSSIENVLLAWATHDEVTLEKFRHGFCQYSDMASFLFGLSYDEILSGYKLGNSNAGYQRLIGKIIILGCGYGMGAHRFQETAKGFGVDLTPEMAEQAVNAYRNKYSLVPKMWYGGNGTAIKTVQNPGIKYKYNDTIFQVVKDRVSTPWLVMTLPSGRAIYYNRPEIKEDKYGYLVSAMGINPYSKKWQRLKIIPGRLAENIIQALARDILAQAKLRTYRAGYKIIASVHDELIFEIPEQNAERTLKQLIDLMCELPPWARGLPLRATGYTADRYRKE